ncbi:hypothetical protein [uncultured Algibacter sp.]|uniref:hypothetical protein n=1 Tax=uncultured Algibacter sp. TaxID=298659 RepID=UPI00260DCC90|nr:hypothetical protein [uncultured Algibacter sp.]
MEFILWGVFRSVFPRKTYRNNYRTLSDMEKVTYLERRRQFKGYKKGWLYFRCKEEGLLKAYKQMFKKESIKSIEAKKNE